jgi:aminomethyltransferase
MANFSGYEMPLWYSSAKKEHLAVLTHAGLFDTSHMATIMVEGDDAHNLLQQCFTNNLDACIGKKGGPIQTGRCVYGAFLNHKGEVLDDGIVYKLTDTQYLIVVNAGMGATMASHITAQRGQGNTTVTDMTDRLGKIDIQGPQAGKILTDVLKNADKVFHQMPYFSFKGHFDVNAPGAQTIRLKNGTAVLISRTGYTGEFGFELFMAAAQTLATWKDIIEAGLPRGLAACGLASRDSLRGGAVLPLSHQDIGPWPFINNPWPFALPFAPDGKRFSKRFIGDRALQELTTADVTLAFVGKDLRKVCIEDPAVVLDPSGRNIGRVLTCVSDMAIGLVDDKIFSIASPDKPEGFKPHGLCCGFVKVSTKLTVGDQVMLKDNRRTITVTITKDIRPDRTARCLMKDMI